MAPEFLSFLIAFLVLAAFWVAHHRLFHHLNSIDTPVLWLNIVILIFVVLVPFTTHVSGDYSSVQIAVILFHVNLLILSLLFICQWQYLLRHPSLLGTVPPDHAKAGVVERMKTPVSACVGILVSFYSPANSMFAYLVVPVGIYAIQVTVRTITHKPPTGS